MASLPQLTMSMLSAPPKIIRIEGFELTARLSETVGNSRQMFDHRGALLLRVTSDIGAAGWGETWAYPGAAAALVRDQFAPVLLGQDATTPRAGWQTMAAQARL